MADIPSIYLEEDDLFQAPKPFRIITGRTFKRTMRMCVGDEQNPIFVDITGCSVAFAITNVLGQTIKQAAGYLVDPINGEFAIELTPAETRSIAMPQNAPPTDNTAPLGRIDVAVMDAAGHCVSILMADVLITRGDA